jgi:ribosomal protein S18 acetylase RimI-like enzyme
MPETKYKLYKLQPKDVPTAGAMLADAFRNDPVWNKVFADDATPRQRNLVFEMPVKYSLRYGEAYAPSEQLEGVIAWVPGHFAEMTGWRILRSGALWSGLKIGAKLASRMQPLNDPMKRDREEHMGENPFLYLFVLGVAPAWQGKGHGGRLVRTLIAEGERLKRPVYLETETEANVAMYKNFGFRQLKKILLPVIDLPMWEMVREPVG